VPPGREGEARPCGAALAIPLDRLAGGPPAKEAALDEVLLPAEAGLGHRGAASGGQLQFEQGFQHADRGVERRARRAVGGLAVPAAVGQLLAEQALDDALHILAEVSAARRDLSVDAGLDLAGEEGVAVIVRRTLPGHAVTGETHRAARLVARGIETHVPQQRQDVHGRVPAAVPRRAAPVTVQSLLRKQLAAPALRRDLGALGGDLVRRRTDQVSHHLPADRRVGIEEPLNNRRLCHREVPFRASLSSKVSTC
jgi:hypothetical protein